MKETHRMGSGPVRHCSVADARAMDIYIFAHLLQSKGSNERSVASLANELKDAGYRRSIVRSDGEQAIKSNIRDAVMQGDTA